jgi:hypothetical protein
MAMMRNIRNMILTGVKPRYHRWIQNKLMDEQTIANSRQFPFSFFSAYEVIPRDMEHYQEMLDQANDVGNRNRPEVCFFFFHFYLHFSHTFNSGS